jgi:regulator of RNase E activity RraA
MRKGRCVVCPPDETSSTLFPWPRRVPGRRRLVSRGLWTTLPDVLGTVHHKVPYKVGPGEINVPVTVGGLTVMPGDIVIGDEDGLLAINPAEASASLRQAQARAAKEAATIQSIEDGTFDRSWIDAQERRMQG